MKIDISKMAQTAKAQEEVLPWDLTLEICGQEFATRALTLLDAAKLERWADMAESEAINFIESLFVDPRPPIGEWLMEDKIGRHEVLAIASIMMAAVEDRARKNSLAIANLARGAMGLPEARAKETKKK